MKSFIKSLEVRYAPFSTNFTYTSGSKKLKQKTQPLGGRSFQYAKLKKKIKTHEIFSSKLKIFKGVALFIPFLLTNIFKNTKISKNLQWYCQNFKIFLENGIIFSPKLKRKTLTKGKNSTSQRTCPLPPSQVMSKKSLALDRNCDSSAAAQKSRIRWFYKSNYCISINLIVMNSKGKEVNRSNF